MGGEKLEEMDRKGDVKNLCGGEGENFQRPTDIHNGFIFPQSKRELFSEK